MKTEKTCLKTYLVHLFGDFYLTWTNRQFDGKNISVQDTPGDTDSISPHATGIKESKSNETLTFRKKESARECVISHP